MRFIVHEGKLKVVTPPPPHPNFPQPPWPKTWMDVARRLGPYPLKTASDTAAQVWVG
jgi:hypothetical protein